MSKGLEALKRIKNDMIYQLQIKGEVVVFAPSYSPCLNEITMEWNSGQLRLKAWLSEERK